VKIRVIVTTLLLALEVWDLDFEAGIKNENRNSYEPGMGSSGTIAPYFVKDCNPWLRTCTDKSARSSFATQKAIVLP